MSVSMFTHICVSKCVYKVKSVCTAALLLCVYYVGCWWMRSLRNCCLCNLCVCVFVCVREKTSFQNVGASCEEPTKYCSSLPLRLGGCCAQDVHAKRDTHTHTHTL